MSVHSVVAEAAAKREEGSVREALARTLVFCQQRICSFLDERFSSPRGALAPSLSEPVVSVACVVDIIRSLKRFFVAASPSEALDPRADAERQSLKACFETAAILPGFLSALMKALLRSQTNGPVSDEASRLSHRRLGEAAADCLSLTHALKRIVENSREGESDRVAELLSEAQEAGLQFLRGCKGSLALCSALAEEGFFHRRSEAEAVASLAARRRRAERSHRASSSSSLRLAALDCETASENRGGVVGFRGKVKDNWRKLLCVHFAVYGQSWLSRREGLFCTNKRVSLWKPKAFCSPPQDPKKKLLSEVKTKWLLSGMPQPRTLVSDALFSKDSVDDSRGASSLSVRMNFVSL